MSRLNRREFLKNIFVGNETARFLLSSDRETIEKDQNLKEIFENLRKFWGEEYTHKICYFIGSEPKVVLLNRDSFNKLIDQMCNKGIRQKQFCTQQIIERSFGTTIQTPSGQRRAFVVHGRLHPLLEGFIISHEIYHLEQKGELTDENEKFAVLNSIYYLIKILGHETLLRIISHNTPRKVAEILNIPPSDDNLIVCADLLNILKKNSQVLKKK
jgi:hypothetical protein